MSRQKKADLTVRKPSSIEAFVRPGPRGQSSSLEDGGREDAAAGTEAPLPSPSALQSGRNLRHRPGRCVA